MVRLMPIWRAAAHLVRRVRFGQRAAGRRRIIGIECRTFGRIEVGRRIELRRLEFIEWPCQRQALYRIRF